MTQPNMGSGQLNQTLKISVPSSLTILAWLASSLLMSCGRTSLRDATSTDDAGLAATSDARVLPDFGLSDEPTDEELRHTAFFHEPLALVGGASTPADNRALSRAIRIDLAGRDRFTTDALDEFVRSHPQSPWRASLLVNLGILYRQIGRYHRSLEVWEEAWALTRGETEEEARGLGDRAVSELALLSAQLGRKSRLDEIHTDLQVRPPLGPAAERYARAQIGRATMEAHPERAYRCGPFSVTSVWTALHPQQTPPSVLLTATSSIQGTSLAQLVSLSSAAGEPMRAMRREPGTAWVVPSVVHWRVDHFAALVAIEQEASGRRIYVLRDPTFGEEVRTTERWLDEEASGYVLVPQQASAPASWREVPSAEAATVWGRGETSVTDGNASGDDDQAGSCGDSRRMARYNLLPHLAALRVEDTPAWLNPSFGPSVDLRIIYNQADWYQPQKRKYTNFGGRWNFNFGAALEGPQGSGTTTRRSPPGGGIRELTISLGTNFGIDPRNGDRLEEVSGSPDERVVRHRDGSLERFVLLSPGFLDRWYLTEQRDAQGNAVTLSYNAERRLGQIVAASGESMSFAYRSDAVFSDQYYLVDHVELSDGRSAHFDYTQRIAGGPWILSGIHDMAGIESSFQYSIVDRGLADGGAIISNDPDFLSSFKTPYGSTGFRTDWAQQGGSGPGAGNYFQRWVEVDLPTGEHERVEYRQVSDTGRAVDCVGLMPCSFRGAGEVVPPSVNAALQENATATGGTALVTTEAVGLNFRNSYHWGPTGYARGRSVGATGVVFDPRFAHVYHWAHRPNASALASALPESEVAPGEGRVTYIYQNQLDRQFLPLLSGNVTWFRPMVMARLALDSDGASELYSHITYGADGNPREIRDEAGRISCLTWATNAIDLLSVHEMPCASVAPTNPEADPTQRLTRLEYDGSLHVPVRVTDAAGQVTRYVYNQRGQVLRVVRPDLKTIDTTYSAGSTFAGTAEPGVTPTEGRLLSVRFPASGVPTGTPVRTMTLTWNPTGTLASIIDPEGVMRGFTWDDVERLTSATAPGFREETYDYRIRDQNGEIFSEQTGLEPTRITLSNADTITRSYDAQHRLIRAAVGPTDVVRYRFNRMEAGRFDLVQKLRGDGNDDLVTRWSVAVPPPAGPLEEQGPVNTAYQPQPTSRVRGSSAATEEATWGRDIIGRLINASEGTHSWHAEYNDSDGLLSRVCDGSVCGATTPRTEYRYEPQVGDSTVTAHLKRLRFVNRFGTSAISEHEQERQYVPFGVPGALNTYAAREASVGDGPTPNVTYAYDILGRLSTATNATAPSIPAETLSWHYDDLDRVDWLTSSLYPGQNLSSYVYPTGQSSARPSAEEMPVHGCRATYGYTGVEHDFAPSSRSVTPAGSTSEIIGFGHAFGTRGRLASERISGGMRYYNYDTTGRMMWADDLVGSTWLYRDNFYDNAGNSMFYNLYLNSLAYFLESVTFDGIDRVVQRQRTGRATINAIHDVRGRVTFDGDNTYTWDANDRLTQVVRASDSATWQFRYDGNGRLRRFVEGGIWHRLVWVNGELYSEYTGTSESQQTTLLRTYHVDGVTQYAGAVGTRYGVERDARGSVRAVLRNGQVSHAWRYDPWGTRSDDGGPVSGVEPRRGFAGYVMHADTGLLFTPARVYQPGLRRWLSRDPLGERDSVDGNNLYAYAANDPVNYVDPTGQFALLLWLATPTGRVVTGAVVGGALNIAGQLAFNGGRPIDWTNVASAAFWGGVVGAYGPSRSLTFTGLATPANEVVQHFWRGAFLNGGAAVCDFATSNIANDENPLRTFLRDPARIGAGFFLAGWLGGRGNTSFPGLALGASPTMASLWGRAFVTGASAAWSGLSHQMSSTMGSAAIQNLPRSQP